MQSTRNIRHHDSHDNHLHTIDVGIARRIKKKGQIFKKLKIEPKIIKKSSNKLLKNLENGVKKIVPNQIIPKGKLGFGRRVRQHEMSKSIYGSQIKKGISIENNPNPNSNPNSNPNPNPNPNPN